VQTTAQLQVWAATQYQCSALAMRTYDWSVTKLL